MKTAKELVNTFYQPLGTLRCDVSSNEMWEYAKERAIEWCKMMISELQQLQKPEYTTFILQYAKFKNGTSEIEIPPITCDGYEKIAYLEELIIEIVDDNF